MFTGLQKTNELYSVRAGVKAMALALFLILVLIPGCITPDNGQDMTPPGGPTESSGCYGSQNGNGNPNNPTAPVDPDCDDSPTDSEASGSPGDNNPDTEEPTDMITIVEIRGEFDRSGKFHAYPWYTYESQRSSLAGNPGGDFSVRTYDDNGNQLEVSFFDLDYSINYIGGFSPEPATSIIPVKLILRFDPEVSLISIFKGDEELYSRTVSKEPPKVSFIGFTENQALPNKTTIAWTASAPSSDELFFNLWYFPRDTEQHLVAADITGNSYNANLTDFPGTRSGYFLIYATDGVRTSEAKSPLISMPFKAPDILTIQTEPFAAKITDEVIYNSQVFDVQDGWLTGKNVRWMLEGEEISVGSALQLRPFRLAPGVYTCTCIATNSAGVSARKDYTFEIIDDASALPDDWSRQEIIYALLKGYSIPINRIESPVTRSEFAGLMHILYSFMNPKGLPQYEKNIVTDCGDYAYSEFLMVRLGVMDAPGGRFEPHRSLTQSEAIRIIYQIWMLASNPGLTINEIAYDEKTVVDTFLCEGILDKNTNTYQPDVRLSKKLALVLVSRTDRFTFRDK